jgi:hypothetical protein
MLAPLDTLPTTLPPDNRTLGWGLLAWALTRFIQPDGPRAGQPLRPTDRQTRFLLYMYEIDDEGRFTHRHLVRRLSKGAGKSPWAAFLALCELCGPVRFNGFDSFDQYGNLLGKRESMPLVQLAATSEDQVANTQRYVREFAGKGSILSREFKLDTGKTIIYAPGGGELRVITSSSTGAEGAQPSFVVLDETEHHVPNNGGVELFETLDRNAAKRAGRVLETCNAWEPGTGSVAETTWNAYLAQQEGKTKSKTKILYDCIEAPADTDLGDEDSLLEALNTVYSDCPWVDTRVIAERVWSLTTPPEISQRFYLNQRVSSAYSWVTPQEWAKLADPTHVTPDKTQIVLFFDGSKSRDATALVGCEMESGHVFTLGVWEPNTAHNSDDTVDAAEVDSAVQAAFERYEVLAFFADVREWESFALTEWPQRYGDDLIVWAAPSARPPQPVAWDMRAHGVDFAKAAEACHEEIVTGEFTHDGNAVTARHVGNAHRRPSKGLISISKESPDSPRKIDAAVCVVGARMVRRMVVGSKEYQKRLRRATGRGRVIVLS